MTRGVSSRSIPDKWLFVSLLVLIAWLPVPLGSNRPWFWGIMEIWAFGLLTIWLFLQGRNSSPVPEILRQHRALIQLLGLWLVYHLLQVVPLPLEIISYLNPAAYSIYSYALEGSESQLYTLSLDPGLTLQAFLKSAAYIAIFLLVIVLTNTRARLRQLVHVLILVAFAESLWAFTLLSLGSPSQGHRATGTFVNANHFAALLEIGIPLTLGMLIGLARRPQYYPNWRIRLYSLLDLLLSGRMRVYLYLAVVVMIAALFFSASRGAAFALLFAFVVTLVLVVMLRGRKTREARLWPVALMSVVVVLTWVGSGALGHRLDILGFQDIYREFMRISSYQMIQDYPIFGIGSGNWSFLYPMYKDPQQFTYQFTTNAHNDHLELLAEQGVIGFSLLGSALLLALVKMGVGLKRRKDPLMRGIQLGCIVAIVSLLMHAWAEFHFHIPANAAWFYVVMGLGLVASRLRGRKSRG